jgi:hypothetical protein
MVIGNGKYYGISDKWDWSLKFAWLPAKMDNSDFVWWKDYYHGVRFIYGPAGESPVVLHQYMTVEDFTWKALKES